jgi:hypothetical protein
LTPSAAASASAPSKALRACVVHAASGPPQLMEMTDGALVVSCAAVVSASRKPRSLLSAN